MKSDLFIFCYGLAECGALEEASLARRTKSRQKCSRPQPLNPTQVQIFGQGVPERAKRSIEWCERLTSPARRKGEQQVGRDVERKTRDGVKTTRWRRGGSERESEVARQRKGKSRCTRASVIPSGGCDQGAPRTIARTSCFGIDQRWKQKSTEVNQVKKKNTLTQVHGQRVALCLVGCFICRTLRFINNDLPAVLRPLYIINATSMSRGRRRTPSISFSTWLSRLPSLLFQKSNTYSAAATGALFSLCSVHSRERLFWVSRETKFTEWDAEGTPVHDFSAERGGVFAFFDFCLISISRGRCYRAADIFRSQDVRRAINVEKNVTHEQFYPLNSIWPQFLTVIHAGVNYI